MWIGMRALACCLLIAGSAAAIQAPPDNYLIYSGKGAATVVLTPFGGLAVEAGQNDATGAVGTIGLVTKGKYAGKFAFHGTINGAPDPDPNGIGWGLVKLAPKTGGVLDQISSVADHVNDADNALFAMGDACNRALVAEMDIGGAMTSLATVHMQVEFSIMNGYTPAKKGKSHLAEIAELTKALTDYKAAIVESGIVTAKTFDDFIKQLTTKKKKKKKIKKILIALLAGLESCNLLQ